MNAAFIYSPWTCGWLASSVVPVLDPASPNARVLDHLFMGVLVVCTIILFIVVGLIGVSLGRFRASGNGTDPPQDFGNRRAEFLWLMPPVLIVLVFAIISAKLVFAINVPAMRELSEGGSDAADVIVVGHQWWWEVRYPASGAVTANEIHIPVGRQMRVRLDSADVIHTFWVPQLGPKKEMIPGHPNYIWLQADRPGVYEGACAQFCGDQHAWMRFIVVADEPSVYRIWIKNQARPAIESNSSLALAGRRIFFAQTCANCHTIAGTTARANAAPDLTHISTRAQLGAGVMDNSPQALARWLKNPQEIKPRCMMPNFGFSDQQVTELTVYLEGLR
jgi:cytochrome c oxidase subunit II